MKSKLLIGLGLLGFISIGMANTKIFNDTAISVDDNGGVINSRYSISINKVLTNTHSNKSILNLPPASTSTQEIGDAIWSFTTGQLPVTEKDCLKAETPMCDKNEESIYCYNHCLVSAYPDVVAFDEKASKVYFLVGTPAIGTGGGPAFLFVADINKKEIKLLSAESDQDKASLSPSGKYLVINGDSILKVHDTHNNIRFKINKSENSYTKGKSIVHELYVKKWLSDTQFIYVDKARYFTHRMDPEKFISAKEVTYDIASKKILSERAMTKDEYDAYQKTI